jgi:hypothetical protein
MSISILHVEMGTNLLVTRIEMEHDRLPVQLDRDGARSAVGVWIVIKRPLMRLTVRIDVGWRRETTPAAALVKIRIPF